MNPPKYISYDNVDLDEPNNLKYPIPDKLYKYTRIHNAKDLLYDNIIYLPEITELNDFMELVDVRDTLEKPILYLKQSEEIRDFIVQDQKVIYRFRMDSNSFANGEVDIENDKH